MHIGDVILCGLRHAIQINQRRVQVRAARAGHDHLRALCAALLRRQVGASGETERNQGKGGQSVLHWANSSLSISKDSVTEGESAHYRGTQPSTGRGTVSMGWSGKQNEFACFPLCSFVSSVVNGFAF